MDETTKKKSRIISEATRQKNRERQAARRLAKPNENRDNMKRWLEKPENVERKKQVQKDYYEANKEVYAANRKKWREEHPEYSKEWHKQNYENNKDQVRDKAIYKKYGVTQEWYEETFLAQGGKCAICQAEKAGGRGRRFHIDHCHKTGVVRGLLCFKCNAILGHAQDNISVLDAAKEYLLAHGAEEHG
jgi:hypothetical protein